MKYYSVIFCGDTYLKLQTQLCANASAVSRKAAANRVSSRQSPTGDDSPTARATTAMMREENTSGRGSGSSVPESVRGWCWGGFLLGWIWALFKRTWIGLLGLIPFLSLPIAILLGIKGREWAWQNKTWANEDHFNKGCWPPYQQKQDQTVRVIL